MTSSLRIKRSHSSFVESPLLEKDGVTVETQKEADAFKSLKSKEASGFSTPTPLSPLKFPPFPVTSADYHSPTRNPFSSVSDASQFNNTHNHDAAAHTAKQQIFASPLKTATDTNFSWKEAALKHLIPGMTEAEENSIFVGSFPSTLLESFHPSTPNKTMPYERINTGGEGNLDKSATSTPIMLNVHSPIVPLFNTSNNDTFPISHVNYLSSNFVDRCIQSKFFVQHPWIPIIVKALLNGDVSSAYSLLDVISEQEEYRFYEARKFNNLQETDFFPAFSVYLDQFSTSEMLRLFDPMDLFMLLTSSIIICNTIHVFNPSLVASLPVLCAVCHIYEVYCLPTIVRFFSMNEMAKPSSRFDSSSRIPSNKATHTSDSADKYGLVDTFICDIPFFHLNVSVAYVLDNATFDSDLPVSISLSSTNSSISEYLNASLATYLSVSSCLHSCGIHKFDETECNSDNQMCSDFRLIANKIDLEAAAEDQERLGTHSKGHFLSFDNNLFAYQSDDSGAIKHVVAALLNTYFHEFLEPNEEASLILQGEKGLTGHRNILKKTELLLDFFQCYLTNGQKHYLSLCMNFFQKRLNGESQLGNNYFASDRMNPLDPSHVYDAYYNIWDLIVFFLETKLKTESGMFKRIASMTDEENEKYIVTCTKLYSYAMLQRCCVRVMLAYWYLFGEPAVFDAPRISELLEQVEKLIEQTAFLLDLNISLSQNYTEEDEAVIGTAEKMEEIFSLQWIKCVQSLCLSTLLLKTMPSCIRAIPIQCDNGEWANHENKNFSNCSAASPPQIPNTQMKALNATLSDDTINLTDTDASLGDITQGFVSKLCIQKNRINEEVMKLRELLFSPLLKSCNEQQRDWMWLDRDELWLQCLQCILSGMLSAGRRICDIEDVSQSEYKTVVDICQARCEEVNIVVSGWQVAAYRVCLLLHQFELTCVITELCRWNYLFEGLLSDNQDEILLPLVELDVCLVKVLLLTSRYSQAEVISENIKKRVNQAAGFPHFRSYCLMLIIDCMLYSSWLDSFLCQYHRSKKYSNGEETRVLQTQTLPVATRHAYEALYHLMLQFHRATAIAMRDVYIGIRGFLIQRPIPDAEDSHGYGNSDAANSFINDIFIMQAVAVAVQAQLILSQSLPVCSDSLLWFEKIHIEGNAILDNLEKESESLSTDNVTDASIDRLITSKRLSFALEKMQNNNSDLFQPLTKELLSDVAFWLCGNAVQQLKWMTHVLSKLGHRELLAVCFLLECKILPDNFEKPEIETANKVNMVFQLGGMNPFFKHKAAQALLGYKNIPGHDWLECQKEAVHLARIIYNQISLVTASQSDMWLLLKHIYDGRSTPNEGEEEV